MIKKIIIFILLFVIFLSHASQINAATSTEGIIDNVKESIKTEVGEYAKEKAEQTKQSIINTIKNKSEQALAFAVKKIPSKMFEGLKIAGERAVYIIKRTTLENIKYWFWERKQAVMLGLSEESREFKYDLEQILLKLNLSKE